MRITVEDAGDVDVEPGTPLAEVLAAVGAPAAVWCGGTRLDGDHRAGIAPFTRAALLSRSPRAPSSAVTGPVLAVIAGPDAGAILPLGRAEATVGREGTLALADARLSRRHLAVDGRGRVRDLGSRNGSILIRGGRRRRLGRVRRRLRPGDAIEAGATVLRWHDPAAALAAAPEPEPDAASGGGRPGTGARGLLATGLAGGAAGALALAAATGRWALALVALAAPLAIGVGAALARRRPVSRAPTGMERLAGLPVPIAVAGTPPRARGVARALALASGARLPGRLDEPWMSWLGAPLADGAVTLVDTADAAPSEAATVIDADVGEIVVRGRAEHWTPAIVSAATADLAARRLASTEPPGLPTAVRWAELADETATPDAGRAHEPATHGHGGRRLTAAIGMSDAGIERLDLDRDGPHVLVAGTTGAGKSALLETLVSALAHDLGPRDLGIALIDLKGGAGLSACAALPHARGTLTDLEPHHARRALQGIAAEVRARKRALADARLSSWAEWERGGGAPARLVVVVDEFQELGSMDPGLVPELTRLAAQGRSLGMHMVLATQRPAGAVTPDIRANVGTVVALRTASAAESHDLLGDGAAAALPSDSPGRAVLSRPGGRRVMQAALPLAEPRPPVRRVDRAAPPGPSVAQVAAARWRDDPPPEPLWLPPLARVSAIREGSFGWIDAPVERRREPLRWDPAAGPCVVVGPRRSGRSAALDAVARALHGCVRLPSDPREAARTLAIAADAGISALLIDDADRAFAALEGQLRGVEHTVDALARQVPLAISCGPGWGARWAARAGLRVVLAGLDPVEQTLWGVPRDLSALAAEPGRGVALDGHVAGECRIALGPRPELRAIVAPLRCPAGLPADAVGVAGDHAAPLRLPARDVTVVGPDGRARRLASAVLGRAGVVHDCHDRAGPGASAVVCVEPTATRLRDLGVPVVPGLVDDAPPAGRVVVVLAGRAVAAQLRDPSSIATA